MKKRVLSLLLAVCLCVGLLPVTALAADVTWVYFAGSSTEYVGGVEGMTYNPYANMLTLTNATITDSRASLDSTLQAAGSLTIALVGDSTITLSDNVQTAISVRSSDIPPAEASLTITGSGSLTIDMTEASISGVKGDICGILISNGNLSIEGGATVKIIGKETSGDKESSGGNNYGISVDGDVTVGEGCKLEATAGAAIGGSIGKAESCGVYAEGNVTVNKGGELTANGGAATYGGRAASYGVYAEGNVTVSGKLEANGGAATSTQGNANSYGVYAGGDVTVSGANAELTARSLDPETENGAAAKGDFVISYGMRVGGNLTLSNGAHVIAQGGKAETIQNGEAISSGLSVLSSEGILVKDVGTTLIARGGESTVTSTISGRPYIVSYGIQMEKGQINIQGGSVEAHGGAAETSTGIEENSESSTGGSSIELNGGSLIATASDEAAISLGTLTATATIKSGSAAFTGRQGGIRAKSLTIGAEEGYVDFQATATGGTDAWAAICVLKESLTEDPDTEPDTVALTNVEILTPEGGTHGRTGVAFGEGTIVLETILETDGTAAKTVHISNLPEEGAEGSLLPGLFLPLLTGALEKEPFDDVAAGDWFYGDVNYVNKYKLMTGTSARKFSPNAPVTRGMVMTILARREGVKTRYEPWYAAGCAWAQAAGISDGTNPEDPITREQLAVMLYRYAVYAGLDVSVGAETNILSFLDALEISDYAFEGLSWAVGSGIMSGAAGVDAGKLLPQATATRAQLAAMLHRFFG